MELELRKKFVANRQRRKSAASEFTKARKELKQLVLKARADTPMTVIAKITGVDRRTLYDILGNDRNSRVGAGMERPK